MSTEGGSTLQLTEKDVVDLLMHAATRQDISELRSEVKQDINRLDNQMQSFRSEMKQDLSHLDNKIETFRLELKQDIAQLRNEVKQDISELRNNDIREIHNDNKWLLRMMVVSILVPIILHFVH